MFCRWRWSTWFASSVSWLALEARQQKVSKRKHTARDGVLQSVSARLGREVKPRKRKGSGHDEFAAKHGSFKPELIRELSFGGSGGGDESSSIAAVKRCDLQSVACGVHVKTGRRARSLALNVLSDKVEKMLKVEAEKCRIAGGGDVAAPRQWHAQKLSWDETSMRFYCPMDIVKTVCPGLSFEPRKMTVPVRKARRTEDASAAASSAADVAPAGVAPSSVAASSAADVAPAAPAEPQTRQVQANAKPAYVVQVMQAGGCIKIGDNIDAEYINRPSVCESTSAEHLYKANPCATNTKTKQQKQNKQKALEPWVRSDALTAAKRDGDHAFLGLHGDSLAANKLLIAQVELETQGSNILLQD